MIRHVDDTKVKLYRELCRLFEDTFPSIEDVLLLDALIKDPAINNPVEHNLLMILQALKKKVNRK